MRAGVFILLAVMATASNYTYLFGALIKAMAAGSKRLHGVLLETVLEHIRPSSQRPIQALFLTDSHRISPFSTER